VWDHITGLLADPRLIRACWPPLSVQTTAPFRPLLAGRHPRPARVSGRAMSNRPDTGSVLGPKGSPRGSGESVEENDERDVSTCGTLDAAASVVASVVVNGPREFTEDWDQVNWARAEEEVPRLRQRPLQGWPAILALVSS
jgi:hypothetical protein